MRWPDEEDVILDAQTTAAAMVLLREQKRGKNLSIPLKLERVCESIIDRRIYGQYWEAFEEQTVTDIVTFFMHCPEQQQPSLGKAYYFISRGGLVSSDFDEKERKEMIRARSSLKAAWKSQARSGPLLWATLVLDEDTEVFWYAPDDIDCFEAANVLVQSRKRLLNLFGIALFSQQKLTRLLAATGARQVKFLTFPKIVKPVAPHIGTFDEEQLKILDGYAAPQ
jgi:hypothetical protein